MSKEEGKQMEPSASGFHGFYQLHVLSTGALPSPFFYTIYD